MALRRRLDGPQGKIALARRWLVLALALVAQVVRDYREALFGAESRGN